MKQEQISFVSESTPKKTGWFSRFLMGSFLIRILLRLTDFCYDKARSSLIGTFFRRYIPKSNSRNGFFRSLSQKTGLRDKFFRPLKFRIAKILDSCLILNLVSRLCNRLLRIPAYEYGILLISYGVTALSLHGVYYFWRHTPLLNTLGMLIAILAVIVAFPLFGVSRSFGSAIAGSKICNLLLFRFMGADEEAFDVPACARPLPGLAAVLGILVGITVLRISPLLHAAAIVALLGLYAILKIPEFGVMLLFLTMPFLPTMVLVGLVLLVFCAYLYKVLCGRRTLRFERADLFVLLFMVLYLLGGIFSSDISLSVMPMCVLVCFMLAYFLVVNLIRNRAWIKRCIGSMVTSVLIVSLYGIYTYFFTTLNTKWQDTTMFEDYAGRVVSTLENPNVLGEFLILAIPFFFVFFFSRKGFSKKVFSLVPLGIVGVCLIFTWSRGAWLGMIFGTLVFLLLYNRKSLTCMFFALFGIPVLPYVLPDSILTRFTSIGNMADSSTSYRVYIWKGTMRMLKDYFTSGIGTGVNIFSTYYPRYSYMGIEAAPHSHNLYLEITVELGLFGLLVFFLAMIFGAKKGLSAMDSAKTGNTRFLVAAGISGIAAVLLQGMTDYIWYNYRVFLWFWLMVGLTCAIASVLKNENRQIEEVI